MRSFTPLIVVATALLGAGGLLFTLNKLEKMEQIRGWKPGGTVRTQVIHEKFVGPRQRACGVYLIDEDTGRRGPFPVYLEPEAWEHLRIGDPIEVVYLPGNSQPYARDGVYASDGNFAFDRALVVVEIATVV